ncbi:hypothetical protein ACJX0J_012208 [Zea mays]
MPFYTGCSTRFPASTSPCMEYDIYDTAMYRVVLIHRERFGGGDYCFSALANFLGVPKWHYNFLCQRVGLNEDFGPLPISLLQAGFLHRVIELLYDMEVLDLGLIQHFLLHKLIVRDAIDQDHIYYISVPIILVTLVELPILLVDIMFDVWSKLPRSIILLYFFMVLTNGKLIH